MTNSDEKAGISSTSPHSSQGSSKAHEVVYLEDHPAGNVSQETQIEGGHVQSGTPDIVEKSRERTRGALLSQLLWVLALLIVIHHVFLGVLVLLGKADVKVLETAFGASLPVIAGLLGSAVAFYFKEK